MAQFYGWAGSCLNVDLTTGKMEKEELSPVFARKYLGGGGFNTAKLFDLVNKGIDALSPENVLMLSAGPLVGTLVPGCSRCTVTAKSPLTDIFSDSNLGGFFGGEMKYAGYDQIVIFGKSVKPVYLWIDDDVVELRDASHLWGRSKSQTARMIKEEIEDTEIQVLSIGQAGENLVRYACIMAGNNAAGRCGMGAVMGSKNLKAVAVRGTKGVKIAKPQEFYEVCRGAFQNVVSNIVSPHPWWRTRGTTCLTELTAPTGRLGVRNRQTTIFKYTEAISGERLERDFTTHMRGCLSCPISCRPFVIVRSGEFAGLHCVGPEFALVELGITCDIGDWPPLLYINDLLNEYGMDCLSTENVIAWAMECYQREILTKEDLDGKALRWGDYASTIEVIHKIARREGFGNILADGEKRAPQQVKKGSERHMYHSKGLSLINEDPRAGRIWGFAYFTSTRGADHLKAMPFNPQHQMGVDDDSEGVGAAVKSAEDRCAMIDAAGICKFNFYNTDRADPDQRLAKLLFLATGMDFDKSEVLEIGERIYNVQKAFNSREGLSRKDDNCSVPEWLAKPIADGPRKGTALGLDEFNKMLDDYYAARDWDKKTGLQTKRKLEQLKLDKIAMELEELKAIR